MLIIDTKTKFEQWLNENGWFEDARILSMTPLPKSERDSLPSTITVELAYQIEGNYKANSTRVSRAFRLVAKDIYEYHLAHGGAYSPEHWSGGIDIIETENTIAFRIDVPAMLTLRCNLVCVEELPNLIETVQAWVSDRDVFARSPSVKMPSPADWVNLFRKHSQNVAWHIYGGEPKPFAEVPRDNYEGWFLQNPAALDKTHQGIFFFACRPEDNGFRMHIENHGASETLWHTAMIILGQFKNVEVHCGNCEFHGGEWLEQINKKDRA